MKEYGRNSHILRYKSAADILGSIRDYILTNTDKLNDFTTGSALETLLEAIATEIEMYYTLSVDNIKGSIDDAIYSAFNLDTYPETVAYGDFIIDFGQPLTTPLQIPSGVKFSSSKLDYDQTYHTLDSYNVPAGTSTYRVRGFCNQGGAYGNIPARIIDRVNNFPDAVGVTNPTSIATGQNGESLGDTKIRFRNLIQALQRGTVQALQYGAKATDPRVQGVFVDESVGYVRLFCHDANGDLPRDLQRKIQANVVNWRPAGIPVEVFPCHKSVVDVGITLDVPNASLRTPELEDEVRRSVTNYINSRQASQDLVVNNIVTQAMNLGSLGIDNVQVNLYVTPDQAMIDGANVNSYNNIILNEHIFNKDILVPKDRAEFNDYVHTPGDRDNPPYRSNAHGDGYIMADVTHDTTDTDGSIDNNNDNWVVNPLDSLVDDTKSSYEDSLINSLSQSDGSKHLIFNESSASSVAESMANKPDSQESLANISRIQLRNSLVGSLSASASSINNPFNSASALSYADSMLSASAFRPSKVSSNVSGKVTDPNKAPANTTSVPTAVSAQDAETGHSLRVLNRYKTAGDEILRAGNVVVDFNQLND